MKKSVVASAGFSSVFLLSLAVLVPVFVLTGCSSLPPKIASPERIARLEVNKSTKEDVLAVMGLPHRREVKTTEGAEAVEYWIYFKGRGKGRTRIFLPVGPFDVGAYTVTAILPVDVSNGERRNLAAIIGFNKDGLVVSLLTGGTES